MHDLARWERSKLEKLTELQTRTIEGLGMLLAAPAPPEAKVAEADALVEHAARAPGDHRWGPECQAASYRARRCRPASCPRVAAQCSTKSLPNRPSNNLPNNINGTAARTAKAKEKRALVRTMPASSA